MQTSTPEGGDTRRLGEPTKAGVAQFDCPDLDMEAEGSAKVADFQAFTRSFAFATTRS